ncbi:hypothetical protein GNI_041180 [Gregarina niphandrodes]|uniref:Uncharacterized protein n=1 Tax=Gregarina niphandrodes TaxID=110365 RepID=A0A023BA53_GRENI|nr:hypothetical protein GNI_041180 [Gregarina niphandrodes]EZG77889.1 hypothetical protein GNI_041180 [Gregarina niphandrodes]|eukprot:XP_011129466.1 hypothetical protein GNI_041180 [Gregarina niphandrodes]
MDQLVHSRPQEGAQGAQGGLHVWRVKVDNLAGGRQYRVLGRVFEDLAAVLPSVVSRLVDIPIYQLPACQPSVERNGDADPGLAPALQLPSAAHPAVLIERTIDSCRISLRFLVAEPELRVPLQLVLRKLRHSLLAQCTTPLLRKHTRYQDPRYADRAYAADPSSSSRDLSSTTSSTQVAHGASMDVDEFTTFMNHVENLLVQDVPVYDAWTRRRRLMRKRPLPGYDLSLIVLASDLRATSASAICNEIIEVTHRHF